MAESHVVTALISKRAELAGLIEHHQKEMGRLADDLAHLDATLKLFSPEIDLRTIRAKAHRMRSRLFRPGECQRLVLDIFREAQGAALSSRQIGQALVARRSDLPLASRRNYALTIGFVRKIANSARAAPAYTARLLALALSGKDRPMASRILAC